MQNEHQAQVEKRFAGTEAEMIMPDLSKLDLGGLEKARSVFVVRANPDPPRLVSFKQEARRKLS